MTAKSRNLLVGFMVFCAMVLLTSLKNMPVPVYSSTVESVGDSTEYYIDQVSPDWELMKNRVKVKGIYMTGYTVGSADRFNKLIDLVKTTELNAVVIDVKDDTGLMTYSSELPDVAFTGANKKVRIKDIDAVMKVLRENNIYAIARIVTFKDRVAGDKYANLAVKNNSGGIWRDRHGMSWLNPYNKESWDYLVDIAEEAAIKGFDEIQFDYVRFPTDGNVKIIDYGKSAAGKSKAEAIAEFLAYARDRLRNMGVVVSADVFGLVTTTKDDMHIGQHLESIAKSVDVICPMVYPSHYGKGSYGVAEPDFEPYKIVNRSMSVAKGRIAAVEGAAQKAILRPWLQDFTASYLPRYKKYGPAEVKAQIKATYDAGAEEWLLWNAGNRFTAGALDKE
ncbi:MAG TPA: putative glycoside hydrolase [Clostridia bacterium]|nr:putative glycoside hydrolase [Clostridia bacterium]